MLIINVFLASYADSPAVHDQRYRNGAGLEAMFREGVDYAQSQDGQDIGILRQGSQKIDGAERHLPIFRPERKSITPGVPSRMSSCDSYSSSEQSMDRRAPSYNVTYHRSIRREPGRVKNGDGRSGIVATAVRSQNEIFSTSIY